MADSCLLSFFRLPVFQFQLWTGHRQKALRTPDHHQYHQAAEHQHAVFVKVAHQLARHNQQNRSEDNGKLRAHAAQYHNRQHEGRLGKGKGLRANKALARGEQRTGKTGKRGADGKGGQLDARRAQAQRAAGDFIFTQRLPRAAQRHTQQAVDHKQAQHHQQQRHQVEEDDAIGRVVLDVKEVAEGIPAAFARAAAELQAKEGRFWNLADAVRAAGDFGVVEQQDTDDFAEA